MFSTRTRLALTMLSAVAIAVIVGVSPAAAGAAAKAGAATGDSGPTAGHDGFAHAGTQPGSDSNSNRAASSPSSYPITGIDVSGHQPNVDWAAVASAGTDFAYVKATEGTTFVSPTFNSQYDGAKSHGLYAGAYAYARPDLSSGTAQADHFIDKARYAIDGQTLPPMLDIEWPYKSAGKYVAPYPCYGLSPAAMVYWIGDFIDEVRARTGSETLIYTNTHWWNPCTAGSTAFADEPLNVANWTVGSDGGELPAGWSTWTFWQYADAGSLPGDQDVFGGTAEQLAALAHNVSGAAAVYGVRADGRVTLTKIDAATGNQTASSPTTTATSLPFQPKAMASLDAKTILMNSGDGHLYRVDVAATKGSLTLAGAPIDLGTGWGALDELSYDGAGHLYAIDRDNGRLRRYTVDSASPTRSDITDFTTIGTGFSSIAAFTSTGDDWLLCASTDGRLISYHVTGVGDWTGSLLDRSGWGHITNLASPGAGVYYAQSNTGALYRYHDADPFDGSGTDIQEYPGDPVDRANWTQTLLSAQPNTVTSGFLDPRS